MARHAWTVICRAVARTESELPQTANISLLEVVQGLVLSEKQAIDQWEAGENIYAGLPMQVISLWARSDFGKGEVAECRYRLRTPSGKEVMEIVDQSRFKLDLEKRVNATARLNLPAFPVRGLGVYYWITELHEPAGKKRKRARWREVSRLPIPMTLLEPTTESR